jgi:hypothetical protein
LSSIVVLGISQDVFSLIVRVLSWQQQRISRLGSWKVAISSIVGPGWTRWENLRSHTTLVYPLLRGKSSEFFVHSFVALSVVVQLFYSFFPLNAFIFFVSLVM